MGDVLATERMDEEVIERSKAMDASARRQLRDRMAMAALTGILSSSKGWIGEGDYEEVARRSYKTADAMLSAREGEK